MIVIGTFLHSLDLELLLAQVEKSPVARKHIMVVPMDMDQETPARLEDQKTHLRHNGAEVGMACATGFSVFGASAGFVLAWGPVIWGLIAAAIGFGAGFGIYYWTRKLGRVRNLPNRLPELIVLVQCGDQQAGLIKDAMWKHSALTVGIIR